MSQKRFFNRLLSYVLCLAMVFTSLNMPAWTMTAKAVENAFEGTSTNGASYNAETKKVTFFVTKDDSNFSAATHMFYKEYATYEEAAAAHISTGSNFIDGLPATNFATNNDEIKSAEVAVSDGTGAILYMFNVPGAARADYEHIIVIGESIGSSPDPGEGGIGSGTDPGEGGAGSGTDPGEGGAGSGSDPGEGGAGSGSGTAVDITDIDEDAISFDSVVTSLYRSEDDGGWAYDSNVAVSYNGKKATVTADNYGWGPGWGIQWKLIGLETNYASNTFSIDVISEKSKQIAYVDGAGEVKTIDLQAGVKKTISYQVNSGTYTAVLDLSGGGAEAAGTMVFANLKFTPVPGAAEVDRTAGDDPSTKADTSGDKTVTNNTKEGYELVWSDEFNGDDASANYDSNGLDLNKWAYQVGTGSKYSLTDWGNSELQCYTDNAANVKVENGHLVITAKYESSGITEVPGETAKTYSSGRIVTKDADALFTTTYGYVEAKMALPATVGAWPAFWMLPQSTDIYGGWPVSGEIDIMESVGAKPNEAGATVHWGKPKDTYVSKSYDFGSTVAGYHTYAVDWEPGSITFYYDGNVVNKLTNWNTIAEGATDGYAFDAPFDQPYYILLNLAVDSGKFGGSANQAYFHDAINMYVDYVRVYQKTGGYPDENIVPTYDVENKADWNTKTGTNLVADISASSIVANQPDVNTLEKNGTVDSGKWYLSYQSDATDATLTTVDANDTTWAKVGVKTAGAQDYSVQLIGHYNAESGYIYKVSFDAYADGAMIGKTVHCDSKEFIGFSAYESKNFKLTALPKTYEYLVHQTEDFANCRMEFNLGAQGTGNVYIGNVSVEIVDPATELEPVKGADESGNFVANGEFTLGKDRKGYWNVGAGTTLKVPRYTKTALKEDDLKVKDVASTLNSSEALTNGGIKYYERRAQISAGAGVATKIYQTGIALPAETYDLKFDLYSAANTTVTPYIYSVNEDGTLKTALVTGNTANYSSSEGLKECTWSLTNPNNETNVALVLEFAEGSNVQIDNVSLKEHSELDVSLPVDLPSIDAGAIRFDSIHQSLYRSEDDDTWEAYDRNVQINYYGKKAVVTADNYSWDQSWGIQWRLIGLESNYVSNIFSIDVISEKAKSIAYVDANGKVVVVDLAAGVKQTISYKVNSGSYTATFDLSGGGAEAAGTMVFGNLKFTPVPGAAEVDRNVGNDPSTMADTSGDKTVTGNTKEGYELVWSDEFNGDDPSANYDSNGLDLNKWAYQVGTGSKYSLTDWGNNELQCYTDNADNVKVEDGHLKITAKYEESGITEVSNEAIKLYSSGRIVTKGMDALFTTTYGYVEAKMALPETVGAWPAFWMLPQSTDIYGGWPVSGEIDIMESVGAKPNEAGATVHWGKPSDTYIAKSYNFGSTVAKYHTYAVDWEPGSITFYYDGHEVNRLTNWNTIAEGATDGYAFDAPFDQPYYILLNLAVDSGKYGGSANQAYFHDAINMYVDYVRVYQKTGGYPDENIVPTYDVENKADWNTKTGVNLVSDISASTIVNDQPDVNGLETAGTVDSDKWYLSYQPDATDATLTTVDANNNTYAKVGITSTGVNDYSVQLIGHYNAESGYTYKVSFDAYADGEMVGKTVHCDSKEFIGFSAFESKNFTLTTKPKTYEYLVRQGVDFNNCRMEFNLGAQGTGNVYIGNVSVEIVDPNTVLVPEREADANRNVVANGDFTQGTDRKGYWNVGDGTTLKVPRYTTTALNANDLKVKDVASTLNSSEALSNGGIKYYERRAQISAGAGVSPKIYQTGIDLSGDRYKLSFDLYSTNNTTVTPALYSVNDDGTLGTALLSSEAIGYSASEGVKTYTWSINNTSNRKNVALVFEFGQGSSVQLDNVSMVAQSIVSDDGNWSGPDMGVANEDGVVTASNINSYGSDWFTPQLYLGDVSLIGGYTYKLSFDYKMSGTSNNKFKYNMQQNGDKGGNWSIEYADGVTEVTYAEGNADKEGFCSYSKEFDVAADKGFDHVIWT